MTGAVELRLVGPEDAALFDRVVAGVFDEPVDPARLAATLSAPGHLFVVALADGVVVGQAAGMIHHHPDKPAELYVDEVGVGDAWLRRGIAAQLLARLIEVGRERGAREAWVGTEPDNAAANALYRRFAPVEVSPFTMYLFRL